MADPSVKPMRDPRTITIKIFVKKDEVQFELVTLGLQHAMELKDAEKEYKEALIKDREEAKINTKRRQNGETLAANQRVHADNYDALREDKHKHLGVHLSFQARDQVMWFSEEDIDFEVDIERDPELILLFDPTPPDRPILAQKNVGIDNPFPTKFPLRSSQGAPVLSGVFGGIQDPKNVRDLLPNPRQNVIDQKYYKYSVRVEGKKTLDPHIAGHIGP